MKKILTLALLMVAFVSYAAPKPVGDATEEPVKKDPASGFWTCNGIRLHMGVDLVSWQNLDDGDVYTELDPPAPEDGKEVKVRGTTYTFASMRNPAVIKFFIVDTSGKKLYLHDDIKFFKLHPCKRDN